MWYSWVSPKIGNRVLKPIFEEKQKQQRLEEFATHFVVLDLFVAALVIKQSLQEVY